MAHTADACPGFCSIMRLGVFLLPHLDRMLVHHKVTPPPPQQLIRRYPFIHLGGERHCESHAVPQLGLEPVPFSSESSALTSRPSRPPQSNDGKCFITLNVPRFEQPSPICLDFLFSQVIIQPVAGGEHGDHLPVAHTCFNLLDLPRYPTKEMMRTKLSQAVEYSKGFGLA